MEAVEGGYQRAAASPDEGVDVASRPSYARRAAAAGVLVAGALLASGAVARGSTLSVDATTELGSLKSAYCNLTISKQTWSVSDPTSAADFLYKYFPVECETDGGFTDYSLCHHSQGECGSYVRLALNGTNEGEHVPCFGLHMVNAKDRPAGNVSVSEVETHSDARLTDMSTYDPFMDISMMFYANSLQTYVEAFERDGIPYMLLKWRDNSGSNIIDDCADTATSASSVSSDCTEGSVFFSLIVHVPHTQINFELVSSLAPETAGGNANVTDAKERNGASERPIFEDPTVRMSHIALSFAGSAPPGSDDLVPLAISEATSDMATVTEYYTTILSADVDYDSEDSDDTIDGYTMKIFRLPGAPMPVKVVQRHVESNYAFGVTELEVAKNSAHKESYESPICGFDQYMDNHFDLTQYDYPVDEWTTRLSDYGYKWHCNRVGFGSLDIYATKPSGDVIQLDGYLTDPGIDYMLNLGCYNVSNVLFHMCSQGKCSWKSENYSPGDSTDDPEDASSSSTDASSATTATTWVDAEGVFGGASAIQAIALSYGVYVSQGVARRAAADGGGHGSPKLGYEILHTNVAGALDKLRFQYEVYDGPTYPQWRSYLLWLKRRLAGGAPVLWFPMRAGGAHDAYGLANATYDVIQPVFGIYSQYALTDASEVFDDDVLAHGSGKGRTRERNSQLQRLLSRPFSTRSGKAPDGSANLGYYRRFDTLVDTLYLRGNCSKADDKRGEAYPCLDVAYDFGVAISGNAAGPSLPVSLALDKDYEPDTDVGDVAALELSATVTVRDVRLNGRYVLFRFDKGNSAVPSESKDYFDAADWALSFAVAGPNGTNATVAYAWEDPHKILSNTTVAYRCVPDTRKHAAPGLARL
ncbi:hypothetical protein JL721_12308 [Aureococcus anophagefferens]|nr:hypothetical protein JL721_12308 [Aureococcus anophagefferens]